MKNYSVAKSIAFSAIMIAIGVVLNILSFPSITFFGRISLVYTFAFLSGLWFGPVRGAIIVALADIIQCIVYPQPGVYVPQITISNALMATIVALMMRVKFIKLDNFKLIISGLLVLFICSAGISAWGEATMLFNVYPYTLAKTIGKTFSITSPYLCIAISKIATQFFWIGLNIALTTFIYNRATRYIFNDNFSFNLGLNNVKRDKNIHAKHI